MKKYTKEQTLTGLVVAILVILIIITVVLYVHAIASKPKIISFSVDNETKSFVLAGTHLSGAEIYTIPTGKNIQPSEYQLLESMVLQSSGSLVNDNQVWVARIPTQEFIASQIFVTVYDDKEDVVGTSSLPYNGPIEIYQALHQFWATTSTSTAI